MSKRIKDVAHTFLDVGSYAPLPTNWISLPSLLRLIGRIVSRLEISKQFALHSLVNSRIDDSTSSMLPTHLDRSELGANLLALFYGAQSATNKSFRDELNAKGTALLVNLDPLKIGEGEDNTLLSQQIIPVIDALQYLLRVLTLDSDGKPLPLGPSPAGTISTKIAGLRNAFSKDPLAAELFETFLLDARSLLSFSPLGVLSTIRYNFVSDDEIIRGPIQQIISLAPRETVEVVTEMVARTVREDEFEQGEESDRERTTENKVSNELTDIISNTITHSTNNSVGVNAGSAMGIVSASGDFNESNVETRSAQSTNKALREMTTKATDRLKRTYKLKIRNVRDITETNSSRRVITNPSDTNATNIAVHQALRKQTVVVQHLGNQLCWQCVVLHPGKYLKVGVLRKTYDDAVDLKSIAPIILPAPTSGTGSIGDAADGLAAHSGRTFNWDIDFNLPPEHSYDQPPNAGDPPNVKIISARVRHMARGNTVGTQHTFNLTILKAVSFSTATVAKAEGTKTQPAQMAGAAGAASQDTIVNNNGLKITVSGTYIYTGHNVDDNLRLELEVEYKYVSSLLAQSADVVQKLESLKQRYARAVQRKEGEASLAKRPTRDLREEERLEVTSRLLQENFSAGAGDAAEFEYMSSLFDFEKMFYALPELLVACNKESVDDGLGNLNEYLVTDKTSAEFGASLHWAKFQPDADRARNVFLNSAYAQVRLPIRNGKEEEAVSWMASNVEGRVFLTAEAEKSLEKKCKDYAARYSAGQLLTDSNGDKVDPGDVPVETKSLADADLAKALTTDKPTNVQIFPVLDKFDVYVPIEGYLYRTIV